MQIINEVNEKYKHMQQELCVLLFEMLHQINVLEKEMGERERIHYESCLNGVKTEPDFLSNLFNEFKDRYKKIVLDKCTEKLLGKGCGIGINVPPKYHYIDEECVVIEVQDNEIKFERKQVAIVMPVIKF